MNIQEIKQAVQPYKDCLSRAETRRDLRGVAECLRVLRNVVPDWPALVLHLIEENERLAGLESQRGKEGV